MARPEVLVYGTFDVEGQPAQGSVNFADTQFSIDTEDGLIHTPVSLTTWLDQNGYFQLHLPLNVTTGTVAAPRSYRASIAVAGYRQTFDFVLDPDVQELDVATLIPIGVPPELQGLYVSSVAGLSGTVTTEELSAVLGELQGLNGNDAYEIWLSQGHTGTVTDFLEFYRGFQGPAGLTGLQGPDGVIGDTGLQGPAGPAGRPFRVEGIVATEALLPNGQARYTIFVTSDTSEYWLNVGSDTWESLGTYRGPQGEPGDVPDKAAIGLDRVDNTNDLEKPISELTQEALDEIAASAGAVKSVNAMIGDVLIGKTEIGLGAVENLSPEEMPVSGPVLEQLELKQDIADVIPPIPPLPPAGTFGTAPLSSPPFPSQVQNYGDEVYLDTNGQLRGRPQILWNSLTATSPPSAYPVGQSILTVNATNVTGWPGSVFGAVVTIKRMETTANPTNGQTQQWWYRNNSAEVMYRYAANDAGGWQAWRTLLLGGASGVWGAALPDWLKLNQPNTPDTLGQPIYVDSAGNLRAQPILLGQSGSNPRLASDPPSSYPWGVSLLGLSGADATAGGWPDNMSCTVLCTRRSEANMSGSSGSVQQCWMRSGSTAATTDMRYRSGVDSTWGPWITVAGDTGWINLTPSAGSGTFQYRIKNDLVWMRANLTGLSIATGTSYLLLAAGVLPVAYRPTVSIYGAANGAASVVQLVSVGTDGAVYLMNGWTGTVSVGRFMTSWPIG